MKTHWPVLSLFFLWSCVSLHKVQTLEELDLPENKGQLVEMDPEVALQLLEEPLTKPILIEFGADWCAPCRTLRSPLRRLAAESQGRFQIVVVDVTDGTAVMESFGLEQRLPAFLVRVPGSSDPVVKYGSGETFENLRAWLLSSERQNKVPFPHAQLKKPKAFKALLIAGSAENANFLQELLWNYSWLQQKGIKTEEIGCFFGRPDIMQYSADKQQFDELKDLIALCYPNNRQQILESLRLSMQQHPQDFYFYMTSHGAPPADRKQIKFLQKNCMSYAPSLILDQIPADCGSKMGLTPDDLAEAMKVSPTTKKYLVLQGCFTGGFISNADDPKESPSALALLPNISIMTASSANRASFGCNSGAQSTLFGYAYGREVIENKKDLDTMDWNQVYTNISKSIRSMEKELQLGDKSNPQYFSN